MVKKIFVEWNKILMGPILNKVGVQQGGIDSDRVYTIESIG